MSPTRVSLVAHVQVELVGDVAADHAAGAVVLEGQALIVRNVHVSVHLENHVRVHREAREEILRILVSAAEPVADQDFAHAGNLADAIAVGFRQRLGERDLVARHQAQRLLGRGIAQIERVVNRDHHTQQAHGHRDAGDGQERPPAIAP